MMFIVLPLLGWFFAVLAYAWSCHACRRRGR